MIAWEKRRGSEFMVSVCTGQAGDRYTQHVPGLVPPGLALPPVGALIRASFIWSVTHGRVHVRRQDGAEFVMDSTRPSASVQVRSLYEFTLLDDDARIVCVSGFDPSVWWMRERMTLRPEQVATVSPAGGARRLLVLRGSVVINDVAVPELTIATLSADREYVLRASQDGADVYVLTHGGAFTFDLPEGALAEYGDGLYV